MDNNIMISNKLKYLKNVIGIKMSLNKIMVVFILCIYTLECISNVEPTSGRYTEDNIDLSIKVIGGKIDWNRDYRLRKWYFNRAWESLTFRYDNFTNNIESIQRANDVYSKLDSAATVFKYGKKFRINRLLDNSWVWKDRSGNTTKYASDGKAISMHTQSGSTITLIYNGDDKLSGAKDINNVQVIWIEYDLISGNISKVKDYDNREISYTWEPINSNVSPIRYKLKQFKDAAGNNWDYTYANSIATDGYVNLISKIAPEGEEMSITYNSSGRVGTINSFNNVTLQYQFDYIKSKKEYYLKITNQTGQITENWYARNGQVIRTNLNNILIFSLIKDIRIEKTFDVFGRVTITYYDEFKNIIKTIFPDGVLTSSTYDIGNSNLLTYTDERGVITKFNYFQNGQLEKTIQAKGTVDERIIEYTYDNFGQIKTIAQISDGNTVSTLRQYFHDGFGNLIKEINPRNIEFQYSNFDSQGNVGKYIDGNQKEWNFKHDNLGNLTEKKSPNQIISKFVYDKNGYATEKINYDTSTFKTFYDSYGYPNRYLDELGGETNIEYDANGVMSKLIFEGGNVIDFEYDAVGRIKKRIFNAEYSIEYVYPTSNNVTVSPGSFYQPIKVIYPTYNVEIKYDLRGRLIEENKKYLRNGINVTEVKSIKYDPKGNIIEEIGVDLINKKYEYDFLDRKVKFFKNNILDITMKYDNRDNMISYSDAKLNEHIFNYDKVNNRIKEIRPNVNQFTLYTYDDDNNIETKIDPLGNKILYHYDDDGRNNKIEYFDLSNILKKTINFTLNSKGSIVHYDDGTSSGDYSLNYFQQVESASVNIDGNTFNHNYTYYKSGYKKSFTGVDGIKYSYFYNKNNKLINIVIPNKGNISYSNFTWDRPKQISYPNNINKTISYAGNQQIEEIDVKSSSNISLMNHGYTYNANGQISQLVTLQGTHQYGYDDKNRVVDATHPTLASEHWNYDLVGNRLEDSQTGTSQWQYNINNELIDSVSNEFTYNPSGNLIEKKDQNSVLINSYQYNEAGRLKILLGSVSTNVFEYYYDPYGNRLYKKDLLNNETTYYHYSDEGLTYEKKQNGTEINYLFYPSIDFYSQPILKKTGTEYNYYFNNLFGTPYSIIDENGVVKKAVEYSVFGNFNNYILVNNHEDNLSFPGQYYDVEKFTYYNINRDYDSSIGRYIQKDPLGIRAGSNEYSYVDNDAINIIDPYGLCVILSICVGPSIDFGGPPRPPRFEPSASVSAGGVSVGTGGGSVGIPVPGPKPNSKKPPPCGAPSTGCSLSLSGFSCSLQYCYKKPVGCKNCENNCS